MPDSDSDFTPGTRIKRQMCAVCRARLNPLQKPDGSISFLHGVLTDHEPRPVNEVLADAILVCDFCLTPHPTWDFPCGEVGSIVNEDTVCVSVSDWAACNACKELIVDDRYTALVERILDKRPTAMDDIVKKSPALAITIRISLMDQMADFRAARTGPPIQITQAQWVAARLSTILGEADGSSS